MTQERKLISTSSSLVILSRGPITQTDFNNYSTLGIQRNQTSDWGMPQDCKQAVKGIVNSIITD